MLAESTTTTDRRIRGNDTGPDSRPVNLTPTNIAPTDESEERP
jgi:hypothetical protein